MKKLISSTMGALLIALSLILSAPLSPSAAMSGQPAAQQQSTDISLTPAADGFSGTYQTDSDTVSIETHQPTKGHSVSRIQHADGRIVMEATHNKTILEIRFSDVKITMDMATKKIVGMSDVDKERLSEFLQSDDAALARKIIAKLLKQRANENKADVYGFIIMGMMLGDGKPAAGSPQSKAESLSNAMTVFVTHRFQHNPRKAEFRRACLEANARRNSGTLNVAFQLPAGFGGGGCNGCCGGGCSTCSGYYTFECLTHDNCVSQAGQAGCIDLFPAAASSLVNAMFRGYGDWTPGDPQPTGYVQPRDEILEGPIALF
jgi:hypothetical protein